MSEIQLLSEPEVRYLRFARLVKLLPQLTFNPFTFEGGQVVYATGPGVPPLMNGSAEDGDGFTASGLLFCKLNEVGLVTEATMSALLER